MAAKGQLTMMPGMVDGVKSVPSERLTMTRSERNFICKCPDGRCSGRAWKRASDVRARRVVPPLTRHRFGQARRSDGSLAAALVAARSSRLGISRRKRRQWSWWRCSGGESRSTSARVFARVCYRSSVYSEWGSVTDPDLVIRPVVGYRRRRRHRRRHWPSPPPAEYMASR